MSKWLDPTCRPLFGQPYIMVTMSGFLLAIQHLHSKTCSFLMADKIYMLERKIENEIHQNYS